MAGPNGPIVETDHRLHPIREFAGQGRGPIMPPVRAARRLVIMQFDGKCTVDGGDRTAHNYCPTRRIGFQHNQVVGACEGRHLIQFPRVSAIGSGKLGMRERGPSGAGSRGKIAEFPEPRMNRVAAHNESNGDQLVAGGRIQFLVLCGVEVCAAVERSVIVREGDGDSSETLLRLS